MFFLRERENAGGSAPKASAAGFGAALRGFKREPLQCGTFISETPAGRFRAGFLLRAALITALVAAVTGSRYFTGTEDWAFWQYAYFFVFLTGHVFVLTLLFLMVPGWLLTKLGLKKCAWGWAFAVIFLGLVLLVADTFVFQQFRLHINLAMLEMTLWAEVRSWRFRP